MKIIVCGDSCMSPVTTPGYEGTHFSEIIAKKLNAELIPLSCGGMSNGGICIQLTSAMSMKPDLILFASTTATRMEYPVRDIPKSLKEIEGDMSVDDLYYKLFISLSSTHSWLNINPSLVSFSFPTGDEDSFEKNFLAPIDPNHTERMRAIKDYINYLYHPDYKAFSDAWMMYGVIQKLKESGIPHIMVFNPLMYLSKLLKPFNPKTYAIHHCRFPTKRINPDPGYHTSPEVQQLIADALLEKYIPYVLNTAIQ